MMFFSNTIDRNVASGIIYSDLSDHLSIFTIVSSQQKQKEFSQNSSFRKLSPENIHNLQCDLKHESWGNILACNDTVIQIKLIDYF